MILPSRTSKCVVSTSSEINFLLYAMAELSFDPSTLRQAQGILGGEHSRTTSSDSRGEVKVKLGKKFDTLVNPEITPSETALMITGITAEELKDAPKWKDVKDDLAKFLGKEIIMGHNIGFDLGYLGNQGIKLKKDNYLDTLDLAVTVLPFSESHSLEYLSEFFQVLQGRPHRALVDAANTARLLAAILNEFLKYPIKLQNQIKEVLARSKVEWKDLVLDLPDQESGVRRQELVKEASPQLPASNFQLQFKDKTIFCFPLTIRHEEQVLPALASQKHSGIVVVSHEFFLNAVPENQRIPAPRRAFCERRFERILKKEALDAVFSKIIMKTLILREFSETFSLSGLKFSWIELKVLHHFLADADLCPAHGCGFYRTLKLSKNKIYFSSLEALFALASDWQLKNSAFDLMLFDLSAIEDEFTENLLTTWNLRAARNVLAHLFPIEAGASIFEKVPQEIMNLANELDLFFGILHLVYLKKQGEFAQNLVIDDAARSDERFAKLFHPARKLISKIDEAIKYLSRPALLSDQETDLELASARAKLLRLSEFIKKFFIEPEEENISWLKFNDTWVDLNLQPAAIAENFHALAKQFKSLSLADNALPKISLAYYQQRLGLRDFSVQACPPRPTSERVEAGVPDDNPQDVPVEIFSKAQSSAQFTEFLQNLAPSTLVILPNETKLSETYQALSKISGSPRLRESEAGRPALAYKFSGSVGQIKVKLAREENKNFILLLTLNSLRYWRALPTAANLVIQRLPFEAQGSKPSLLGHEQQQAFVSHVLPRSVEILHSLLCRFLAASNAPKIFILDPRILTDYDQSFMRYLEEFPEFLISTR